MSTSYQSFGVSLIKNLTSQEIINDIQNFYFEIKSKVTLGKLNFEEEKDKIKSVDFKTLLNYIKETVEILIKLKVEEHSILLNRDMKSTINKEDDPCSRQEYEKDICILESEIRKHIKKENEMKIHIDMIESKLYEYEEILSEFGELQQRIDDFEKMKSDHELKKDTCRKENEIYILKSENSNLKNSIKLLEEKIKKQELIEESLRKHFKEKTIKYDEILDRLKQKIASLEIYNSNHKLEKKSLSLTSRTSMTNFTTKARELRQSIDNKLSKNYVSNIEEADKIEDINSLKKYNSIDYENKRPTQTISPDTSGKNTLIKKNRQRSCETDNFRKNLYKVENNLRERERALTPISHVQKDNIGTKITPMIVYKTRKYSGYAEKHQKSVSPNNNEKSRSPNSKRSNLKSAKYTQNYVNNMSLNSNSNQFIQTSVNGTNISSKNKNQINFNNMRNILHKIKQTNSHEDILGKQSKSIKSSTSSVLNI